MLTLSDDFAHLDAIVVLEELSTYLGHLEVARDLLGDPRSPRRC